jgi:hypothetical protein
VVQLEDLSTEFKFTIKEVSSKIRSLEMNKMLNGVIDERGKYIFLTERELQVIPFSKPKENSRLYHSKRAHQQARAASILQRLNLT